MELFHSDTDVVPDSATIVSPETSITFSAPLVSTTEQEAKIFDAGSPKSRLNFSLLQQDFLHFLKVTVTAKTLSCTMNFLNHLYR